MPRRFIFINTAFIACLTLCGMIWAAEKPTVKAKRPRLKPRPSLERTIHFELMPVEGGSYRVIGKIDDPAGSLWVEGHRITVKNDGRFEVEPKLLEHRSKFTFELIDKNGEITYVTQELPRRDLPDADEPASE